MHLESHLNVVVFFKSSFQEILTLKLSAFYPVCPSVCVPLHLTHIGITENIVSYPIVLQCKIHGPKWYYFILSEMVFGKKTYFRQ